MRKTKTALVPLLLLWLATGCATRRAVNQPCRLNEDCEASLLCVGAFCRAPCSADRDCAQDLRCVTGPDPSRSLCVGATTPPLCGASSECAAGRACVEGQCSPACTSSAQCADTFSHDAFCGADGRCHLPWSLADAGADASSPDAATEAAAPDAPLDAPAESSAPDAADVPDVSDVSDAAASDTGPELDCLDNVDNDGNGLVDCADPACMPRVRCEVSAWTAQGTLHTGAAGASAPCAAGETEAYRGARGAAGAAASCACACTNPVGSASCSIPPSVNHYTSASCPPGVPPGYTNFAGACTDETFVSAGYNLRNGLAERGTCTATTTPTMTAATGPTAEARLCVASSPEGGGCGAGSVCRPRSTPSAGSCVARAGEYACPAEYAQRQVFYGGSSDTRGCNPCTCGYLSDGCAGDVVAYAGAGCTGAVLLSASTTEMSCHAGDPASYRLSNVRSVNPRCVTGPGSPSGCVRDSNPTTLCCAPAPGERPCPTGPGPAMARVTGSTGSFCVDTTEVTNAQYADFLAATPSTAGQPASCAWNASYVPAGWPATAPNQAVVGVDWCDAAAYCRWAGRTLCGRADGATPLTEAEATGTSSQWFQACSQGNTTPVPYGPAVNEAVCPSALLTADANSRPCCATATPRVYELLTNALEWVDACSGSAGATDTCRAVGASGAMNTCATGARPFARNTVNRALGFRCCAP